MRFLLKAVLTILLMVFLVDFTALTEESSAQVLLKQSDLIYQGAFRLPQGPLPGATYGFDYANPGFAYNPAHSSLFVNNHT